MAYIKIGGRIDGKNVDDYWRMWKESHKKVVQLSQDKAFLSGWLAEFVPMKEILDELEKAQKEYHS